MRIVSGDPAKIRVSRRTPRELSFSRVRRGYCSRTSPDRYRERLSHHASRHRATLCVCVYVCAYVCVCMYIYIHIYNIYCIYRVVVRLRRVSSRQNRRISRTIKIYATNYWLPPHVRYHESVLSCTVLRISLAPPPRLSALPHSLLLFSSSWFFFSFSSIPLSNFAGVCSVDTVVLSTASAWIAMPK